MRATGDLSTAMLEGLDGVRVVKMENREADEEARVATVVAARQRFIVHGADARAIAAPASEVLTIAIAAAILGYKGWQALTEHPDVGAFFTFFFALLTAGQALRQVSNLSTVVSQGLAAGRRLFSALDVRPEIRDAAGAPALNVTTGDVELSHVSFSYGEAAPVLHDVSLTARRGETVALVGPSGAGKTTVLGLIPRFLRHRRRRPSHRRPGCPRDEPEFVARSHRPGYPGAVPVRRHRRRQHSLFQGGGEPERHRGGGARRGRP